MDVTSSCTSIPAQDTLDRLEMLNRHPVESTDDERRVILFCFRPAIQRRDRNGYTVNTKYLSSSFKSREYTERRWMKNEKSARLHEQLLGDDKRCG